MIFEELHTYLETTRSELSRDVLYFDKSSLSGEWMKREERFALFSFFENLIEIGTIYGHFPRLYVGEYENFYS